MNPHAQRILHFMNRIQEIREQEFTDLSPADGVFAMQMLSGTLCRMFIEKAIEMEERKHPIPKPPSGKIV